MGAKKAAKLKKSKKLPATKPLTILHPIGSPAGRGTGRQRAS